jgi:hypothetical protein
MPNIRRLLDDLFSQDAPWLAPRVAMRTAANVADEPVIVVVRALNKKYNICIEHEFVSIIDVGHET